MILVLTSWDWTEVAEGVSVSLLFISIPLAWRMEFNHRRAQRQREHHHAEVMLAHRKVHEHLGIGVSAEGDTINGRGGA